MVKIEGNIINNNKIFRGLIEIDTEGPKRGIITKIGEPVGDADFVFKDELIFPGFVDVHVHAREDQSHSQDYKEDFQTAGEAAINGGVVAFCDMPNNPIPPVDDKTYATKESLAEKCPVKVVLYGGIGPDTRPISKKVPYKIFMGHSVGHLFFGSKETIEKAVKEYGGQNISFHCEDPKILEEHKEGVSHEAKRPKEAEISAVDFAIELIEKYRLSGKVCHVSTVEAVEKIISAKNRGVKITAEVTPHHLYFDETMIEKEKINFQVNPPIRQTKENRLALIKYLKEGAIDFLATDHAPHSPEEKAQGMSGLTHLDTYGSFTTWLMKEHDFTPSDIARVCAENPGDFINEFLDEKYGKVEEGYAGSLTIIDPNKPIKISKEILKTKNKMSPFEGVMFPGSVIMTIIKGKIYDKR